MSKTRAVYRLIPSVPFSIELEGGQQLPPAEYGNCVSVHLLVK